MATAPILNSFLSIYPSAARTTHPTPTVYQNTQYKGIKLYVNVTAFSGTSITFTLADSADGDAFTTVLASAALSATGQVVLTVYPGLTETANVDQSAVLGRKWKLTPSGTITSVTYEVTAVLIV
jgi:hypothetical protein